MRLVHADVLQGVRNVDPLAQIEDPVEHGGKGRVRQIEIAGEGGHLVLDGRSVEGEHVGHDHCVGEAVVGVEHRAAGVAERVHRAEALLKGGRAHGGRDLHAGAGGEVGSLRDGGRESVVDEAHPFERDPLREGMEDGARERFEAVGEGVHSDRRGEVGGSPTVSSGSRITRPGIIAGWKMIRLTWSPRVSVMGGRAPGLRAGAGGGRDGDHRHYAGLVDPGPPVLAVLEVPDGPGLAHHERDCLPGVEGAAAPEGDDAVVLPAPERLHPVEDVRLDRVAADIREDRAAESRLLAGDDRFGHHRQGGEPRVRDQQGACDPELAARVGQLADAARPEADRGGVAPVSGEGGQLFHRSLRHSKSEA